MVALAIVDGLFCTFDQSILVVDADIVADAIVEGLFEIPFQSAEEEIIALLEIVAEVDNVELEDQVELAATVDDADITALEDICAEEE
jgi:hypothetical protein